MNKVILLFVLIFSTFAIKPLFINGFFHIHDDTQVVRVYEMGKAIKDGYFPVRWVKDLGYGYGYPLYNFYAPFSYYVGGFFNTIGFDSLYATKITIILGIYFSAVFMYLAVKDMWGDVGGLVSALLYVYAPFHGLDLYVRGDVAELYAYGFIPLLLFGLWNFYKTQRYKYIAVCIVGYALVILSHNLTAFMITPFLGFFLFVLIFYFLKKGMYKEAFYLFSIPFVSVFISAWYWLPAISEMKYTNVLSQIGGGADYKDHFVCLSQLWNSPWGYGGSTKGCIDGLSFKIGKLHLILIALAAVLAFRFKRSTELFVLIGIFFLLFVFSIFMTLPESKIIWDSIPFMAFLQYPWRFLMLVSFFGSVLAGSLFTLPYITIKKYVLNGIFSAFIFVVILIYSSLRIFVPQYVFPTSETDFINDYNIKWTTSKISDEYVPIDFLKPKSYSEVPKTILSGSQIKKVDIQTDKTNEFKLKTTVVKEGEVFLNLTFFPFWNIFVDGKKQNYKAINGRMRIYLPKGETIISGNIEQTKVEKLSDILSLTGVLLLIVGIISSRRKTS